MDGSRKRLVPFMEKMINRCPGVVWENREERMFRIPWKHYNNRCWMESDSKIFLEWAKITGKYKDGDEYDWPLWKTQLRCALNKIPEIVTVQLLYNLDGPNPYRVYQFVSPVSKSSPNRSGDSKLSPSMEGDNMISLPDMNQLDKMLEQDLQPDPSSSQQGDFYPYQYYQLVPTVVQEEEKKYVNLSSVGLSACSNISPVMSDDQVFYALTPINNFDISPVNSSINAHCTLVNDPQSNTELVENMETSLPSDLKGIEGLCHAEHISIPGVLSIPSSFGSNLGPSGDQLQQDAFTVKLYYGFQRKCEVLSGKVSTRGCRLFFKKTDLNDLKNTLMMSMYGPSAVEQFEIPSVDRWKGDLDDSQCSNLNQLLNNMDRGLVLTIDNGDIYAQRLCKTRVYVTDGTSYTTLLERQKNAVKIFDFSEHRRKKRPDFILTFGQEIKIGYSSPLKKILMSMEIEHDGLKSILHTRDQVDSLTSINPLISNDNEEDKLLARFSKLTSIK